MITGRRGLDVSSLVRSVLAGRERGVDERGPAPLDSSISWRTQIPEPELRSASPYERLFSTRLGQQAASAIGNESRTLDALSSLSVEVLYESLSGNPELDKLAAGGSRFLVVPGLPEEPPALLILDPRARLSDSRRLTGEVIPDQTALVRAFDRLRAHLLEQPEPLAKALLSAGPNAARELLSITRPEVILSRRPRMVPLSVPSPFQEITHGTKVSSVGALCRDRDGEVGVSGCYHGTGRAGTVVAIAGRAATVKRDSETQDIVFIPFPHALGIAAASGRGGVRTSRAPSEAEPVHFEGAGSRTQVATRVKSHDAGILRISPRRQLKVQTPADTNTGDSGSALVDDADQIVGFAFERTGLGEFPEMTDWIWAANALAALELTAL